METDNQDPQASDQSQQIAIDPTDWAQSIPTDLAQEALWAPLKGKPLSTVLKGYAEAQKTVGGMVKLPMGPDDTDGHNKMFDRMGRPAAAAEYELSLDQNLMDWDETVIAGYKEASHALGLNSKQVQGMLDWYTKSTSDTVGALDNETAEADALTEVKMRQEFGPNYEYNKGIALKAAHEYFGAEIAEGMSEDISGNEGIFRGLLKLGQELAEHGVFGSNPHATLGGVSPAEAQTKIAEVNGNQNHAYWDRMNPDHARAQKDMAAWFNLAYPSTK